MGSLDSCSRVQGGRATRNFGPTLLVLGAFFAAAPASAVDGVIEISQGSVEAAGGFPFNIDTAGSYRLTSNLVYTSPNTVAIRVREGGAGSTIDLNGFAIIGPTNCAVSPEGPIACVNTGNGDAIQSLASADGVTVKNGRVQGAGRAGINLLGDHGSVRNVHATQNGATGIRTVVGGTLADNRADLNGGHGLEASAVAVVNGNLAHRNGGDGIRCATAASIEGNISSGNGASGIVAGSHSLVRNNVAYENGSFGLNLQSPTDTGVGYTNNVFGLNAATAAGTIDLGGNVCNGSETCP